MLNIPKPKIEGVSAITIASPDLEKSLEFYQKLGFSEVMRFDYPFPWIQVSDGALLIMLRLDPNPYIALTYYVNEFEKVISDLEESRITFFSKPTDSDFVKRYVIQSPDGILISLINITEGFNQPPGPTMLTMPQEDYLKTDKYPNKICGLFGEFAHPVKDIATSMEFWEKLGYKMLSKFEKPYPWAIISDGLHVVGLHQTYNFTTPAITYFAIDMKAKINKLKEEGLMDFKEKGGPGNIILTTPENQTIFLFSMGM